MSRIGEIRTAVVCLLLVPISIVAWAEETSNTFTLSTGINFEPPWLSLENGIGSTLVLQKQRGSGMGFSSNCECLYDLKISIAASRLHPGTTLYVVNENVVIGRVRAP